MLQQAELVLRVVSSFLGRAALPTTLGPRLSTGPPSPLPQPHSSWLEARRLKAVDGLIKNGDSVTVSPFISHSFLTKMPQFLNFSKFL